MELDDTDVFESDDRGNTTTMIDEMDEEGKMRYLKRYAKDEDDINTKRLLNIILEIGEINPPYLRRHLKLISEILCRVIKSGQPQMVLRGYQAVRNLSQILKSPFSVTYWKYLKLSFSNLLSPVQAIVDYALQMIYEMHSSFDPTYFIKTLRSVLLQTQNVNLKINFAICLYQLLCHQKSNITQYCPTYFELFILMNDKSKPLKQVCKETGKYLKALYGEDDLKNMMFTYFKVGRIRRIQEVLCLKLVSEDGDIDTSTSSSGGGGGGKGMSLNESSIHVEDDEENEDEEGNNNSSKRRISTTSDSSEAEAKMASIAIGQHKFTIKKQSPTLIPAPRPYFPKENKRKSVTTTVKLEERSKSAPTKEGTTEGPPPAKEPHKRTISKTIERSRSVRQPYKSIVGKSDTSAYEKKVERIRRSILRSATGKNKAPVKYKKVKKNTKKTAKLDKDQPLEKTPRKSTTSAGSGKRSPSRTSMSTTKATIQKIMAKARKEREEKAARISPKKKSITEKKETKKEEEEEEEMIKQEEQVEEQPTDKFEEEQAASIEIPKLEEERALEEQQQQESEEKEKEDEEERKRREEEEEIQRQKEEEEAKEKLIKEEEEEFAEEAPEEIQMPLEPAAALDEPSPLAESPKAEEKPVEETETVQPSVEKEEEEEEEVREKEEEREKEEKEEEKEEEEEEEERKQEKEGSEEEEEEDIDDEGKSAREMLEELLSTISPEDKIKYQNELMVLGRITDYFDSDSDYDSYSDSYDDDEEEEEEEVKEKLPTLDEKDENIEEEDEDENDKDIKNWNIFDSDYEEVSDDESYTGEDPVLPGDEEEDN